MEIVKLLSNPVRIQVMQYLQTHGDATTKQISEALKDTPSSTLYRQINILIKEKVLLIKQERKIRGSLERLLTINADKMSALLNKNIADTAYQFLMELYIKFQKYSRNEDADLQKDRIGLRTSVLRLTDDSFDDFMGEIMTVVDKYQIAEEKGKLRNISFISAPVEEENQQD